MMQTHVLVIGVVERDGAVLLRKKPEGAPPYDESWYLFGAEVDAEHQDAEQELIAKIKDQTGITVTPVERLGWDTEAKPDLQGEPAFYIYLDCRCEYVSGDVEPGDGIERLEWVEIDDLGEYDIVPPARTLFEKYGYL